MNLRQVWVKHMLFVIYMCYLLTEKIHGVCSLVVQAGGAQTGNGNYCTLMVNSWQLSHGQFEHVYTTDTSG